MFRVARTSCYRTRYVLPNISWNIYIQQLCHHLFIKFVQKLVPPSVCLSKLINLIGLHLSIISYTYHISFNLAYTSLHYHSKMSEVSVFYVVSCKKSITPIWPLHASHWATHLQIMTGGIAAPSGDIWRVRTNQIRHRLHYICICSMEIKWDGTQTKIWHDNDMRWIRIWWWFIVPKKVEQINDYLFKVKKYKHMWMNEMSVNDSRRWNNESIPWRNQSWDSLGECRLKLRKRTVKQIGF